MIKLEFPYPPSANHSYSYIHGRPVLTQDARAYRHAVRKIIASQRLKPFMGPLAIRIDMFPPDQRRRDCDNVQKAVLDAMQHGGMFWDDSQVVWLLTIKLASMPLGLIGVTLDDFTPDVLTNHLEGMSVINETTTQEVAGS